ncbi:hypothetical protein PybrP1_011173 [[Pythium] brassicae (nom. inval.)]|nr:hypothetical protein PybrP1_011173 [[Pythium] brassicae (nom. inval.)]
MSDSIDSVILYVGTYSRKEGHVDGKGKGVYAFRFDLLTGALAPLGLQAEVGINPSYIGGTRKALYAVSECAEPQVGDAGQTTGYVYALAIGADGALTPLNRFETRGAYPCYLSVSPDEDFVAVANYGGGSAVLFPIAADGSLLEAADFHAFDGASLVKPDRQEAAHVHSTTWVPGANYLFAADLGNDRVAQFELDKAAQKLVPNRAGAFASRPGGTGPRHLAIHPSLQFVYVLDELSSTIGVHTYDAATGALSATALQDISTIPDDFTGTTLSADIHLSASGDFVYASNRGHDSIAIFRIKHEERGTLELVGFEPTRGKAPRNFLVYRDFLLVANQDTDTIELFHIDAVNGKLTFTGVTAECPTPVSLFVVPHYGVASEHQRLHQRQRGRTALDAVHPNEPLTISSSCTHVPMYPCTHEPMYHCHSLLILAMPRSAEASARRVWAKDANDAQQQSPSVAAALGAFSFSHNLRRDVLAYCKLVGVTPHPKLVPTHPDEEETLGADGSACVYDLSETESVAVKNWQLDRGNCQGLLFNVMLDREQLQLICRTIPKTQVQVLQLEWNVSEPVKADGATATPAASTPGAPSDSHGVEDARGSAQQEKALDCDDESAVFAQLLEAPSPLVVLSLRANGIASAGATAIAHALRTNSTLQSLNLFQNRVGDDGALAIAHALPHNTALKALSLASNGLTGAGARALIGAITKYVAPPALLKEIEDAESRIQAEIEHAKKAKKKIDRRTAMANVGLPVLEVVDGVQYAPGNVALEELVLSGNAAISEDDALAMSDALDAFPAKLQTHLRHVKLQRLPRLRGGVVSQRGRKLSEFLVL